IFKTGIPAFIAPHIAPCVSKFLSRIGTAGIAPYVSIFYSAPKNQGSYFRLFSIDIYASFI
ncbi:MAG TPA: hypothetical protein PK755_10810, partial [Spirochaetota bacterium]|nr:hypothetical protein [Spirochaetota bacterium]